MNKLLTLAINKLGHDWSHLNWEFRDFELEDGTPDKMSQWQGDSEEDIMIVAFKGKHISEPFHRQDFFFIDYAYHLDYNALSSKYDNLNTSLHSSSEICCLNRLIGLNMFVLVSLN